MSAFSLAPVLLLQLTGGAADRQPFDGYTLFTPLHSTSTYLIDMQGAVVHEWKSAWNPGNSVYLLDDGSILRCARDGANPTFRGGGEGGRVQRIAWDGELLWDFPWSDEGRLQHHDVAPMPNGNVLLISWERRTEAEALAAGRDPALLGGGELWPDYLVEIEPKGATGGTVVWEWHAWDHLIQDRDPAKAGFGVVADHPERIDVNGEQVREVLDDAAIADLAELGYIGGDDDEDPPPQERAGFRGADWLHTNSIDYHPGLDQILLSVRSFNEIWIIDHATTTAQAAGRRGDLLYRWGNPQTWMAGTEDDRRLFVQHDAQWIDQAPGHVLVFNNGGGRPSGNWSSVDEIVLPLDEAGRYDRGDRPFLPRQAVWTYRAEEPGSFFASHISGAQRLPNGNTLVCSGGEGRFFEVALDGQVVWAYRNVYGEEEASRVRGPGGPGRPLRGRPPGPPPGRRGGGKAVFRATRIPPEHPGLAALAGAGSREAG